jgi:quercetin dioxygenase-like cupin family protein
MGQIHRFSGSESAFDWDGVSEIAVDDRRSSGVTGRLLIGPKGDVPNFRIRYFRIEPGGYTPSERHPHDHGIFVLHGHVQVRLGSEEVTLGPRDVVYVPGNEHHQLKTVGDEPVGLLCVVPPRVEK